VATQRTVAYDRTHEQSGRKDSPLAAPRQEAEDLANSRLVQSARVFVFRTIRAVKLVVRDGRIPRPLRWCGALGLAPIPGPFDEVVLLVSAGLSGCFTAISSATPGSALDSA
jgi:hypothetical protein